jgi:hypothetical protein
MAPQTRPRITRRTVDQLACELHEQLLNQPNDSEVDHVFAVLIPKGIDPTDPAVLSSISSTKPVLLHRNADGIATQPFNDKWNFWAFSMYGDYLEQLENMNLPKGTGIIALNLLAKDVCIDCDDSGVACRVSTQRLSLVVSRRHTAGVVSDNHEPPMFFDQNGGLAIEAMKNALSRT